MNFSAIKQQFLRDLKASAAKSALLAVLFLVGLCFWIPQLLKAFSGDSNTATATTAVKASVPAATTPTATKESQPTGTLQSHQSRDLVQLLDEHPFLQPATAAESRQRPFGIDADALPLPVLFAEDELPELPVIVAETKPVERLDGLLLKSTLIGSTRRAAMINNRLYHEGDSVSWNSRTLQLESIQRKSVTLTEGSQSWQLTLEDSDRRIEQ